VTEGAIIRINKVASLPLSGELPSYLTNGELAQQLADLRVEVLAVRNLLDAALELLESDVPPADVARFLRLPELAHTQGCQCALHQRLRAA